MGLGLWAGAAGFLTHYSMAPLFLFLCLHFFISEFWHRKGAIGPAWGSITAALLLMSLWFGWMMTNFDREQIAGRFLRPFSPLNPLIPMIQNFVNSINLPHFLDKPPYLFEFGKLVGIRDFAFVLYQTNLLFLFGSVGWILVLWQTASSLRKPSDRAAVLFWTGLVAVGSVGALFLIPHPEEFGTAHLVFQPLVLLGLAFAASGFREYPKFLKSIFMGGILIDAGLGIWLHFKVQSLNFLNKEIFSAYQIPALPPPLKENLSQKTNFDLPFLGDLVEGFSVFFWIIALTIMAFCFYKLAKELLEDQDILRP